MTDLTEVTVGQLLELLAEDNTRNPIALDAVEKVVSMILEQAASFYEEMIGRNRNDDIRHAALRVAASFVIHPADEDNFIPFDPDYTELIVKLLVDLAFELQYSKRFEIAPATQAQLERIANSAEGDQPSQPTTPTTTALAPVEADPRPVLRSRRARDGGAEASNG
jgi:hypothetical protein